jgi:hypothetical protein
MSLSGQSARSRNAPEPSARHYRSRGDLGSPSPADGNRFSSDTAYFVCSRAYARGTENGSAARMARVRSLIVRIARSATLTWLPAASRSTCAWIEAGSNLVSASSTTLTVLCRAVLRTDVYIQKNLRTKVSRSTTQGLW